MSKIYTAADQLIGHTPLLELTHIEKEQELPAHIIAKLEYFNPAGSVKDRIAKKMIDDAEEKGLHWGFVRDKDNRLYLNNTVFAEDMADEHWVAIEDAL